MRRPLPTPPPAAETVELHHPHRINSTVYTGRIQVSPELAATLRAADALASVNDRVWDRPHTLPPQPL